MRILDLKKTHLFILLLVTLVSLNSVSFAQSSASKTVIKEKIVKYSLENGVDPALALSIAQQESKFNKNARSSQGAVGVFQMLPSTAKTLGINPYCLNGNIIGGVKYLKMMQDSFGSVELAIAAYNAGPGAVRRHKGVPPYSQTRAYVRKIMANYNYLKANPDPAMIKVAKQKQSPEVIQIPSDTAIFLAKPAIADAFVKMNHTKQVIE
jgi:soluble lytic murein transglycosylase-like protein